MIVSERTKNPPVLKPRKVCITVTRMNVLINPDRVDDFTDELEALCRKYAGDHYALDWTEK